MDLDDAEPATDKKKKKKKRKDIVAEATAAGEAAMEADAAVAAAGKGFALKNILKGLHIAKAEHPLDQHASCQAATKPVQVRLSWHDCRAHD